ncbi:MAG: MiaB/RimO family radical SAM methylthiotransferase [Candidatus Shapirobacteria bacterium]|nr:MiaB/RimO family radical SAM methylthiotransferase [Candidatus Shapirobacteria bacterium]
MTLNKLKTYYIKTFGCQANKADSERIVGFLNRAGLKQVSDCQKAELVVINSCSVRQSAEDRSIGLVHKFSQKQPRPVIVVSGCVLYHNEKYLKAKFDSKVDFFIKTASWLDFTTKHWPTMNGQILLPERKTTDVANILIMEGCNNFCSYCVVPYARGQERSLEPREIICQIKQVVKSGGREVLLLGQNVNSYGKDLKNSQLKFLDRGKFKTPFAVLLNSINKIEGIKKISFLTSNPQDLDDDIIKALVLSKVDRQLHLPVQSGDDQILGAMNRKYTTLQYIKLVKKIKNEVPGIKVSTDIIVGFPGETRKQFQNTVSLCQQIKFNKAYVNKYSPRPQTAAARLIDNVSWQEKRRRWLVLEKLINQPDV